MISFRRGRSIVRRPNFFTGETNDRGLADIAWHGCQLGSPGWSDPNASALAFTMGGSGGHDDLHAMLNMSGQDLEFEIPPVPGRRWWRAVDTFLPSPEDIAEHGREIEIKPADHYHVNAHSVVVLIAR
jgi:isoamylase